MQWWHSSGFADLDIWAFGEEIGYVSYLLTRAADVGGRSKAAYQAGVLVVAVLFGYGHYYKGPYRDCRVRHDWPDFWGCLPVVGRQPVGLHSGPWIH
jgi:membrane protease YdiL (CAAX protease family)